jgi:hypothetical protein
VLGCVPAKVTAAQISPGDRCEGHFVTMLGYGRPDWESFNIGHPAGRRPAGEPMLRLSAITHTTLKSRGIRDVAQGWPRVCFCVQ